MFRARRSNAERGYRRTGRFYFIQPNTLVIVSQELPCGWLDQGTRIRTYKLSESKANKIFNRQMQVEKSRVSDQILIFINLDRPPNSSKITHIPYGEYKVKYICVLAKKDDTLLNALKNDGRFKEPEKWTLHSTNTASDVPLSSKAKHCENYIFDVKYNARKKNCGESRSESKTCPRSNIQIKAEKFEEDEFMGYSGDEYSGDEYSGDESNGGKSEDAKFYQEILQFAKEYAYTWLEREKRGNLAALIEESFSKPIDQTKSVWLMERLVSASKSVGHIYTEGCPGGTCFLIREDVILTNYHVYDQIKNFIAKHRDPSKVIVSFNYLFPNQRDGLEEVEVDIDRVYAENKEKSLDYIFLGLKNASDQSTCSRR
ncbi:uncharacterized protein LOC114531981 isoform X2 [Dendronephthya gigantea]|uniref:uncharacterized protein LOC114531981 isoform X2 n=1 Tax=Dendronephthya gigantea TaxID=151771 RepID=UPI00106A55E8|nr:uncharacterized protein LOC114531981 isoform X2 [Dendronephthya gigantea]